MKTSGVRKVTKSVVGCVWSLTDWFSVLVILDGVTTCNVLINCTIVVALASGSVQGMSCMETARHFLFVWY